MSDPTLDYARGGMTYSESSDDLYRRTRAIALLPQTVGLLILVSFVFTRWEGFALIGLLWIPAGGVVTATAAIMAIAYRRQIKRDDTDRPRRLRQSMTLFVMMLLNVVVCGLCIGGGLFFVHQFSSFRVS